MKNLILIITGLLIATSIFSQNSFIYTKDGKFMNGCEEFKPIVMNYGVVPIKDINGEYHLSPHRSSCWSNGTCYTCGPDNEAWKEQMLEHLIAIDSMGFNTIRLYGNDLHTTTRISQIDNPVFKHTLRLAEYYIQDESGCYGSGSPLYSGEVLNEDTWYIQGDLLAEFIDIINTNELDLKIIFLLGGAGYEVFAEYLTGYFEYFSDRFKDEPALWAYDIYNEASYHSANIWEPGDKYSPANVVEAWSNAIRENSYSHYTTIGLSLNDVLFWDPVTLPVDFQSYHFYPDREHQYANAGYDTTYHAFKGKMKWIGTNYADQMWIVGETSFGGEDEIHLINENVPTEEEQRLFANSTLMYAGWYGAKGFSWFPYKDEPFELTTSPLAFQNYVGLVRMYDNEQEHKPAGNEFTNYLFTNECEDCTDPTPEFYYNPYGYQNVDVSGKITANGVGISDAYIYCAKALELINPETGELEVQYKGFFTFTDEDGNYDLYTLEADVDSTECIYSMKVSKPGYTVVYENNHHYDLPFTLNFELELLDQNLLPPMPELDDLVISSGENVIWDYPISGNFLNINIMSGASLTISSELYMNHENSIKIYPGGELIVDGGLISSSCGFWKGIEVLGFPGSSDPNDLGRLQIINGGTIEKSEIAVKNYAIPFIDEGGIIEADGAVFKNNEIAIELRERNNGCYFSNCSFVTNVDYPGTQPDKFVYLYHFDGVPFNNCTFKNRINEHEGYGILADNSSFSVNGSNTLFNNLLYAIRSTGIGTTLPSTIKESAFSNNYRGIYISAINEMVVTNCTINIPPETPMVLNGVPTHGLYMDECTGYTIEENVFDTYGSGDKGTVGLYIHESGTANNMVYNNIFNNLQNATVAYGLNRSSPFSMKNSGLCYKCNEFTNNNYDIVVNGSSANDGIMKIQGSSGSEPDDPAGNRFSWTGPEGTPTDINNQMAHFTYHHHVDEYVPVEPEYFTESTVTLDPNFVAVWNEAYSCPPSSNGGGGGSEGGDRGSLETQITTNETEAQNIQATLDIIIDGGNTEALENYVETSYPPESFDVYSDLMNKSPYLSNEVVDASIEKDDVLPNVMIRDVMVANPQTAKEDELVDKLNERSEPMPDYMLAQILQGRSLVGYMEELYSQKSHFEQKRTLAFNSLLRIIIEDESITQEQRIDELIALFLNENTLEVQYRLSMLYFAKEDYLSGQNILNNISSNFELTVEQLTALDYFNDFYQIMIDLNQSEEGLSDLQKAELHSIMQADAGLSGAYARNLLMAYDEMEYIEPVILPSLAKSAEAEQEYNDLMQALEDHHYLKSYPNPAKDHIIIEYELEMDPTAIGYDAQIMIYDNKGVLQQTIQVNTISDKKVIDTRNLPVGVYFVSLLINNNEVESIKFTIVK